MYLNGSLTSLTEVALLRDGGNASQLNMKIGQSFAGML